MKNPRQICREHNLNSYQAQKGAEVMADHIREEVERIMTTPSDKTVYEQLREYFGMVEEAEATSTKERKSDSKVKYPRGC